MSQEFTDPDGSGVDETIDDTSAADAGDIAPSAPAAPAAPTAPAGRMFNQDQVNAFIANERRKWESSRRETPAPTPPAATPGNGPRPFDQETATALQAFLEPHLAPLRQQAVSNEIDRATNSIRSKHAELQGDAGRANMDAIINLVLTWDPGIVNTAPMDWLMEQGYNAWKWGGYDEKAHQEKIISDYREGKIKVARQTPTPQGPGGRAPTLPASKKSKPGDFSDADAAMRALVREAEANS